MRDLHILTDGLQISKADGTGLKHYALSVLRAHEALGIKTSALYETQHSDNPCINGLLLAEGASPKKKTFRQASRLIKSWTRIGTAIKPMPCDFSQIIEQERPKAKNITTYSLPACYKEANQMLQDFNTPLLARFPDKISFWHATHPLPIHIKGVRKITTIHDLIALRMPNVTITDKRSKYNLIKDTIENSKVLIAVSKQTKHEILNYFPAVPEEKIHVTYMTPSIQSLPGNGQVVKNVLDCMDLQQDNYILFLANIEPKKNIRRLLDAYAMLKTDLPLVIAGKKAWMYEEQLGRLEYDKKLSSRVRLLGYVPDDYRAPLYMGARCFIFPSICEGFGIPPLDAMYCGCPVITSRIEAHEEVCGDAVHYVDPYDIQDMTNSMDRLIHDGSYRSTLIEKGRIKAAEFTLENHVAALSKAYQAALEG